MNTKFLESYKKIYHFIKKASKCVTLQRHETPAVTDTKIAFLE